MRQPVIESAIIFNHFCSANFCVLTITGKVPGLEICCSLQVYHEVDLSDSQFPYRNNKVVTRL